VRRLVLLICALVLLADLSDDGQLGRVRLVAPPTPVKSLSAAGDHPYDGVADCQPIVTTVSFQGASPLSRGQPIPIGRSPRPILTYPQLASAGGLPW